MNPLDCVPTFLLYDALSWCIKNKKDQAHFFRRKNAGERENISATPDMIHTELKRRESEIIDGSICCMNCKEVTDGRCYFREEKLCSSCYWTYIKFIAMIGEGQHLQYFIGLSGLPPSKKQVQPEETRDEIALRLGVSLDMLEGTNFFD